MLFNGPHGACRQPQADATAKRLAMHGCRLQVRQETTARTVVRVADIVARHNSLSSDLTAFGHDGGSPVSDKEINIGATSEAQTSHQTADEAWV